jgi:hypothetical protein
MTNATMTRTRNEIETARHLSETQRKNLELAHKRNKPSTLQRTQVVLQAREESNEELIAIVGKTCGLENVLPVTAATVAAIFAYLTAYASYACGQTTTKPTPPECLTYVDEDGDEHKSTDPLFSAFLKQGGLEHSKSRGDTFDEMVSTVFTESFELFRKGSNSDQQFPVVMYDKWGKARVELREATHAFKGLLRGCASRVLINNSASVNISETAEGSFAGYVDKQGKPRDPDVSEKSARIIASLPANQRKAVVRMIETRKESNHQFNLDKSNGRNPRPAKCASIQSIAQTMGVHKLTVRAAVRNYADGMRSED